MKHVVVHSLEGHNYTVEADEGRHTLTMDEPVSEHGEDLGPTPYEALLAALGGCMAITAKIYANRHEWRLEGVSVDLTHDKVVARDCSECTPAEIEAAGPDGRIDLIRTQVSFRGELTPEQIARLREVTERCPIHRTLQRPTKIVAMPVPLA